MKTNNAWNKFVNLLANDEDFRKKFDAIEVPEDAPAPALSDKELDMVNKAMNKIYKN